MSSQQKLLLFVVCALALIANIAGLLFNLYAIAQFDEVLHAFTLFAITWFLAYLAEGKILMGPTNHPVMMIVALTLSGVGVGGLWEVVEWFYDMLTPANSIQGKDDTMTDLIADTLGSAMAAIAYVLLWRQPDVNSNRDA